MRSRFRATFLLALRLHVRPEVGGRRLGREGAGTFLAWPGGWFRFRELLPLPLLQLLEWAGSRVSLATGSGEREGFEEAGFCSAMGSGSWPPLPAPLSKGGGGGGRGWRKAGLSKAVFARAAGAGKLPGRK